MRYLGDAKKDATTAAQKAERVRQRLAELTSSINQVHMGGDAGALKDDLKAFPSIMSHNKMDQDISNTAIDAHHVMERINAGDFKVGPDAVRRAQDGHNPALMRPARVQDAAQSIIARQNEAKENVDHIVKLGQQISQDIEQHASEIEGLGVVDGASTEELPGWLEAGAKKLPEMESTLTRVAVSERKASTEAQRAFRAQATDELGEAKTQSTIQKDIQFSDDFKGGHVNEAMKSLFTDP